MREPGKVNQANRHLPSLFPQKNPRFPASGKSLPFARKRGFSCPHGGKLLQCQDAGECIVQVPKAEAMLHSGWQHGFGLLDLDWHQQEQSGGESAWQKDSTAFPVTSAKYASTTRRKCCAAREIYRLLCHSNVISRASR